MENQALDNSFLGTAPIGKLLWKLSLPAITAQLINMLYNLVDRIYIGHIPNVGSLALTGVGVCLPLILLVSAFAALVSMGASPRASIFMGKKDNKTAEKIMGNSFIILVVISMVLTGILLVFKEPLLMIFGASENTIEFASDYLAIYSIGTIFVQLSLGMNSFITAMGFAKTSMYTVLIGAIANIILDPIFIFGLHMGVKGAALATIISQCISTIWIMKFLFGKKTVLKLSKNNFKLEKKIFLPSIALGLAPFIMQSTESALIMCFNASLLKYGGDIAVGAMTILMSVMQFTMMPLNGIGQGAQPITSYNYGAGNGDRTKKTFKLLLTLCLIYSGIIWLSVMLFPEFFSRIFSSDIALVEFTSSALKIYMATGVLMGAQSACQMTLIAIGKTGPSVFLALLRKLILLIPLIYILPHFFENKVNAVYLAEPISDFIAVSCTLIIFIFQFRKAISELESPLTAKQ